MLCIYLHGFRSSPRSQKARILTRALTWTELWVPELLGSPQECLRQVEASEAFQTAQTVYLIGSSLGGFYAMCLANRHPQKITKAVLLNPAIRPSETLYACRGQEWQLWHDPSRSIVFSESDHAQLVDFERQVLDKELTTKLLVVLGELDQVVPCKESEEYFASPPLSRSSQVRVLPNGDHDLSQALLDNLQIVLEFLDPKM